MKALIKSKLIYNGRQVQNTVIEVGQSELDYFDSINVKYELIEEKEEKIFKRKKVNEDTV